ncbi:hypothetical protein V8C44DRAFT_333537 [Trichoderma aethiopicum]
MDIEPAPTFSTQVARCPSLSNLKQWGNLPHEGCICISVIEREVELGVRRRATAQAIRRMSTSRVQPPSASA